MLSERKWKIEAVLMLGSLLMFSLALGMLLTLALKRILPDLAVADEKFFTFVIGTLSFHGVALLLTHTFLLRHHELTWPEFLGLTHPGLGRALLLAAAVTAMALPIALMLNKLAETILTLLQGGAEMQPTMKILELSVTAWQRAVFGASAIVLAPATEEILFRGILYRVIREHGHPRWALFGSAFLFAGIHLSWMTLVPLFFLGLVLALLYEKTGALLAPIVAHALFNAVNFFAFILNHS